MQCYIQFSSLKCFRWHVFNAVQSSETCFEVCACTSCIEYSKLKECMYISLGLSSSHLASYTGWAEYEARRSAHCVGEDNHCGVSLTQGVEPEKLFAVPLETKHNKVFVSLAQIFVHLYILKFALPFKQLKLYSQLMSG